MIFTLTDRQFNILDAYETEDYLIGKYVGTIIQTLEIDVLVKSENSDKWAHGNYIMCEDKTGYKYWFTIYEAEDSYQSDIKSLTCYSGTIDIVAEDANPIERPSEAKAFTYYFDKIFHDTGVKIGKNEIKEMFRTLEFTSENASNAEMLQYVLNAFNNAEADLIVEFDGSIPVALVLNVYNRIGGGDPQTLLSDEDGSLVSLERTGSITHLATAIVPIGKEDEEGEPVTLLGKHYSEWDDNGKLLYYSPADHNRIYSVVGRREFMVRLPDKDTGEFDGYINRRYQSEATTQDALWSAALKQLKELDKPQVIYEAKGHINCNIGDNIQIISNEMKPQVMISARVLEYKFNDDDSTRNEYTFGNYRVLDSKLDELTKFKKEVGLAISRTYRHIDRVEESVRESINFVLTTADGKNSISYGNDQPIDSRNGDLWYRNHPSNNGERQMMVFHDGVWEEQTYRADMLTGTFDASKLNVVNIHTDSIIGNISQFIQSYWNDINSQVHIDGNELSIANTVTGVKVTFKNGEIVFSQGSQVRHLRYTSEGLALVPGSANTGTALNGSLHIQGGIAYLQFVNNQNQVMGRIEFDNPNKRTRFFSESEVQFVRYSDGLGTGIAANGFRTLDNSGNGNTLTVRGNRIETPRDDKARNIYLVPNGQGSVIASDHADNHFYNMVAATFVQASSETFKQNIESADEINGTDTINSLVVKTFEYKEDAAHENRIGFIAEENPAIATPDARGVDYGKAIAYLVKATQEMDKEIQELKELLKEKGVI